MQFPDDFPDQPPLVRFKTPIHHLNVNVVRSYGRAAPWLALPRLVLMHSRVDAVHFGLDEVLSAESFLFFTCIWLSRFQYGKVCHGVLSRDWASSLSIRSVLDCVYGLLLSPDQGDSLDSKLALLAYNNFEAYKALVKPEGEARRKCRQDWLRELDQGALRLCIASAFVCMANVCPPSIHLTPLLFSFV